MRQNHIDWRLKRNEFIERIASGKLAEFARQTGSGFGPEPQPSGPGVEFIETAE